MFFFACYCLVFCCFLIVLHEHPLEFKDFKFSAWVSGLGLSAQGFSMENPPKKSKQPMQRQKR